MEEAAMVRARFTEDRMPIFCSLKRRTPNEALYEEYGFSNSTLRRWQEMLKAYAGN